MSEGQADRIGFDAFVIDLNARQLWRGSERVHLNPRYFDALVLLARNPGKALSRQRFMDEVWQDAVVGDEALSQCIAALRRALGDNASKPRFIRTVPRRGYEFLVHPSTPASDSAGSVRLIAGAVVGGALAGAIGGMIYGAGLSFGHAMTDTTAIMAVMLAVNTGIGALAALGTGAGLAAGIAWRGGIIASIVGAALGGLAVGAIVRWLSSEAFVLLFGLGMVPGTGAVEGVVLGAALGTGLVLGHGRTASRMATCSAIVALAAVLVVALGGHLMAGSLQMLANEVGSSPIKFDHFGALIGEDGFALPVRLLLAALEGGILGAGVAFGVSRARAWPSAAGMTQINS
ncbi:MAG: transcriptional regulator [Woeseia sp.]